MSVRLKKLISLFRLISFLSLDLCTCFLHAIFLGDTFNCKQNLHKQPLFFDPMNNRKGHPFWWIEHNVTMSVCLSWIRLKKLIFHKASFTNMKKLITLSRLIAFSSRNLTFRIQLSYDPMNHRTSLLMAYSPSISHNVRPSVLERPKSW